LAIPKFLAAEIAIMHMPLPQHANIKAIRGLGFILAPIFATNSPTLVMAYVFGFMVLVSAYEAAARPKAGRDEVGTVK
jgi:ABC-type iron transport system FetAB permease component